MSGRLERRGDGWQLRFERRFDAPIEAVWNALIEPEDLAAWFPQRIVGEWCVGAPLRFEFTDQDVPPFEGIVRVFEPPSSLEYSWGTDVLRFELVADGLRCVLTLLDQFDEGGKAVRDAAGWHACLDFLEAHLTETKPPWTSSERWRELHREYLDSMPAEAATIGPPAMLDPDAASAG